MVACLTLSAQAPQQFKYQAVARDISGNILPNQDISLRISILEGTVGGTALFVETHDVTTNSYGLISLSIGAGVNVSGSIDAISWGANIYFLKTEMDPAGETTYVDMGTSQLLSVPYALSAGSADNIFSGNYADLTGVPVNISEFTNDAGYLDTETQALTDVLGQGNDAGGLKIANLADPEDPQDAVTKEYLRELMNRLETLENVNGLKVYDDTLSDVEGNEYRAIEIGNQMWMVDNLKTTKYAYGSDITGVLVYDNLESNAEKLGRLYSWNDVMDGNASSHYNPSYIQGVCPDEWHVPSDAEWKELEMYLGMDESTANLSNAWRGANNEGGKLKAIDFMWDSPNTGATNSSGFYALPSGAFSSSFTAINKYCYFSTSTEADALNSFDRILGYNQNNIMRQSNIPKTYSLSVRCVENRYPVLHNALGSISEVQNSAFGPDGSVVGTVNFNNDVKFGKGITPNTGSAGSGVDFPTTMLNPEAGCIEMWTKFYEAPVANNYGVYGLVNVAHWNHAPVSLYWHNSGSDLSGTIGFGPINYIATLHGFNPAFNTPVHIAFAWDRNGIDGTGDYLRLYVDGVIVATNTTDNTWGTDTSGHFRVAAPWDNSFATDRYSVDNIKVWDYAKTDFANRIFE